MLLQSKGFLKLKDGVGLKPTIIGITENKKKLQIRELDAAQLPRSLGDVDAAAINTNYAIEARLDPNKDAFIRETPNSPYTNLIAVRTADAQLKSWSRPISPSRLRPSSSNGSKAQSWPAGRLSRFFIDQTRGEPHLPSGRCGSPKPQKA